MELELINRFTNDTEVHNLYAEIPGTDPKLKDEIVLIGAHYDSWHGGTSAADNPGRIPNNPAIDLNQLQQRAF